MKAGRRAVLAEAKRLPLRGVGGRHGAGIDVERGHLTMKRGAFFDHPMGLLRASFHDPKLTVSDSECSRLPRELWSPRAYPN